MEVVFVKPPRIAFGEDAWHTDRKPLAAGTLHHGRDGESQQGGAD
jgi:hypothetical protein